MTVSSIGSEIHCQFFIKFACSYISKYFPNLELKCELLTFSDIGRPPWSAEEYDIGYNPTDAQLISALQQQLRKQNALNNYGV